MSNNDIEYPTADEVNALLTQAEARFGSKWDQRDEVRPLLFAAAGCKAEAIAFARLAEVLR